MSCVVHTSDGGSIRVNVPAKIVIGDLATALANKQPTRLADGQMLPPGFMTFDPVDGATQYVNGAEIARVVDE